MSVDVVGDFLTIIRNGIAASKRSVKAPHSQLREQIARILKDEGFIVDYGVEDVREGVKEMTLNLKYKGAESVIHEIVRMSTPGRRMYRSLDAVEPVIGGLGVTIISTNRGVMTHKEAKKHAVGGEVICTIW